MASSQDKKEELHVLLVAFSAQGHINPLLRLGKTLLTKGLHVTLATTQIVYHRVFKPTTADDATVPASITTNGIQVIFFSDGFGTGKDRKVLNVDHFMDIIGKVGPNNLSNLIKEHFINNSKKLACIINNPFIPWVADVAANFNIPCACLWIQPCALYAIYYRFYNNLNQFPTQQNPQMTVHLPGLPPLQPQDLPSFLLPSNTHQSMPKVLKEVFQHANKIKWFLANSFHHLEKEAIASMDEVCPITTVGPLVPPSLVGQEETEDVGLEMWRAGESCMEWLNQQAPSSVIYVSFGSLLEFSSKELESIAKALKNSSKPFLWVNKGVDREQEEQVVQLLKGLVEKRKERGMVVSWCPQTKVLSHPAIACFLTHCGWNSILEAITTGTPMVAWPKWTDQPTNAKLISDVFRLGVRLAPDAEGFVAAEEVERAFQRIFAAAEFRSNASELKRAAREAVSPGGSSDRNIQSFVDEIIGGRFGE
ncbi:hypothetical protein Fmac_023279 [Flemingia macrophylla]|uniref:Glycosyltransferase n=1 Tax=Flemingia macrophylla TaxID=520843 RepID=A0ABD1LL24_9FABA